MITVPMIVNMDIKTAKDGYDMEEVDRLLDTICDQMEANDAEREQLSNRIATLQSQLDEARSNAVSAAPQESSSDSMKRMMERTQRLCDEIITEAQAEADRIRDEARKAGGFTIAPDNSALIRERDELRAEVSRLRNAASAYKKRMSDLLEDQRTALESSELFEG